jgi:hypothetical protein
LLALVPEKVNIDNVSGWQVRKSGVSGGTLMRPASEAVGAALAGRARRVIVRGDFVSPLHVFYDLPSFFWCNDAATQPREELVRLCYLPESGGVPLKVRSVCLPFVLVKQPNGMRQTLDIRKIRLARLDAKYAKAAWKLCKKKNAETGKRL